MDIVADVWRFTETGTHGLVTFPDHAIFPEFGNCLKYTPFKTDSDFAYIAEFESRLIIAFQGTSNLKAWISDFNAFPLREPNPKKFLVYVNDKSRAGTIHCGFYIAWLNFKETFQKYLLKYVFDKTGEEPSVKSKLGYIWEKYKLPPLYHFGHSRGGALCTLSARDAAKNLGIKCSCYAFGAPRIGTNVFCDEVNALPITYINIHHGAEFTQFLPPKCAGFRHAGSRMQLKENVWHKIFYRIRDHYLGRTTDAISRYCLNNGDKEGAHWMNDIVRKRVLN